MRIGTNADFTLVKGNDIYLTKDGGYVITGEAKNNSNDDEDHDVCLIKLNSAGKQEWTMLYRGNKYDAGTIILQTSDGGYVIGGETKSWGNGDRDIFLIKTDGHGSLQWAKTFGGSSTEMLTAIVELENGNFAASGSTNSFGQGSFDAFLIKVNKEGNLIWSKSYGDKSMNDAVALQKTSDGFVMGGNTIGTTSSSDVYLIKTDSEGNNCNGKDASAQSRNFVPVVKNISAITIVDKTASANMGSQSIDGSAIHSVHQDDYSRCFSLYRSVNRSSTEGC